jgi:hypothetical protein
MRIEELGADELTMMRIIMGKRSANQSVVD